MSMETTTATPIARTPTETVAPSPLTLTAKAVEMVKEAMVKENLGGYGIRIGVVGGGCSGFQYSMDFENVERDGDSLYEQDGVKVYVDTMSSMYLQGVTVDYVIGLQGAGFKFVNPNARNTCGCGSSFTP
jgi:iron-sulfur cluster assembly accessory protein